MSASHICRDVGLATGAWETYLSLKEECLLSRAFINCQTILRLGGAWRSIPISAGTTADLILYRSCMGNYGWYEFITITALTPLNLPLQRLYNLLSPQEE